MLFLIESVIACILFTLIIKLISRNRQEVFTNDYPPVVTDKLRAQGLIAKKPPARKKDVIRKLTALVVYALLFALLMRHVNGIETFLEATLTVYGLWLVVDWYDAFILDIGWFCHSKKVRIPGTEDLVDAYKDYWFHIKCSLIGMVLGFPACLIAGVFCQIAGLL